MFKPIDLKRYVMKNYRMMLEDYNIFLFVFTFVIMPVLLSVLVIFFIESKEITSIVHKSIGFFSIIVGFLINVLVLLLSKSQNDKQDKLNKDIEKLRKHLSFNILNSIIFGIVLVVLILFYGNYDFMINLRWFMLNVSELVILFLLFHVIMLILNIIRKFGVYVETRYK
jgi:hypothetical protein